MLWGCISRACLDMLDVDVHLGHSQLGCAMEVDLLEEDAERQEQLYQEVHSMHGGHSRAWWARCPWHSPGHFWHPWQNCLTNKLNCIEFQKSDRNFLHCLPFVTPS